MATSGPTARLASFLCDRQATHKRLHQVLDICHCVVNNSKFIYDFTGIPLPAGRSLRSGGVACCRRQPRVCEGTRNGRFRIRNHVLLPDVPRYGGLAWDAMCLWRQCAHTGRGRSLHVRRIASADRTSTIRSLCYARPDLCGWSICEVTVLPVACPRQRICAFFHTWLGYRRSFCIRALPIKGLLCFTFGSSFFWLWGSAVWTSEVS